MIKLKWPEYSCLWICNVDAQIFDWIIDLSVWIKWTPWEDGKSNNAAQDDEQQTTTLICWNHKEKTSIYVKITYLDWEKDEEKWFQVKNWPKITPQWRNWKKKPREKKLGPAYSHSFILFPIIRSLLKRTNHRKNPCETQNLWGWGICKEREKRCKI